jgi:putative ABC transport system permease protein
MFYLKLVLSSIRREPSRVLSALFGIAAAVGLLAWHLGLACTALSQSRDAVAAATAPYSAWIVGPTAPRPAPRGAAAGSAAPDGPTRPQAAQTIGRRPPSGPAAPLPSGLAPAIGASPFVQSALPLAVQSFSLDFRPGGRVLQGPPMMAAFAPLPASGLPFATPVLEGRLPDPGSETPEVLADLSLFGRRVPKPDLGSPMPIVLPQGVCSATIVGFYRGSPLIPDFPTAWLNPAAVRAIAPLAPRRSFDAPNLLLVETAPRADPAGLAPILDSLPGGAACRLATRAAVESRFRSDTVSNLVRSLPLSLSLAVLTASFMLVAVMNIGLAARRRQLAVLRCIGLSRRGAAALAALETLFLLLPGWLLGLLGGTAVLQAFLLVERSPELPRIARIGWQTPLATLLLALVVGLLAMFIPALRAMRVRPLEIYARDPAPPRPFLLRRALLAAVLLLPLPLLSLVAAPFGPLALHLSMLLVGLPAFAFGIALAAHPLMCLAERLFARPLGALLRLDPRLLVRRLSRDPHRVLGTIASLTLGLGAFIAIHIWGATLMASYVPSPEWPDAIASLLPSGVPRDQAASLGVLPGLRRPPIPVEATQFPLDSASNDAIARRGLPVPRGLLLLFGADPLAAYAGPDPFAPFRFVEGDPDTAARALADGPACIVPAMFSRMTGLHLGDAFSVAGRTLAIAGVVELNWHLVTSRALVRTRSGRTVPPSSSPDGRPSADRPGVPPASAPPLPTGPTFSMAFVSEKFARECTGDADRTHFLWLSCDAPTRALHPLQAALRVEESLRDALSPDSTYALRVHARDEIADGTLAHGNDILGTMARIPFWSLLVTASGLVALLLASARASKPELAAMRAVGMTRSQLRRLLYAEAALVALCAVLASLVAGVILGWSFTAWTRLAMPAGLPVALVVPWTRLAQGVLFLLALAALMSLIPLRRLPRLVDTP